MFQKILVCLDGSKLAEQILPYAAEQAARFGSNLVLFQVVSLASLPASTGIESVPVAVPNDQLAEAEAAAKDYLDGLALPLRAERFEGPVCDQDRASCRVHRQLRGREQIQSSGSLLLMVAAA